MLRKIKLVPRKQSLIDQGRTLKGSPLRPSVAIGGRLANSLLKHIDRMVKTTEREIKALFQAPEFAEACGMDANAGSQARITLNSLTDRFNKMFGGIAQPLATKMVNQVDKNSAATLKGSLKDLSGGLSIDTGIMTGALQDIFTASTYEAAHLIKRVPSEYLDQIYEGTLRAITLGKGLADIVPILEKQKVKVRNWAKNVSMDQTRKAYSGMTAGRMKAVGINKYEWLHSGGSNHPRPYHRDVLNGQIFSLEDPPIIDPKTGERGKPGDAVYCRCHMRPIISFED